MNIKNSFVAQEEPLELTDTDLENVNGGHFRHGFGDSSSRYGFGANRFSFGDTNQNATAIASAPGGSGNYSINASATNYYTFIYAPSFTFNR